MNCVLKVSVHSRESLTLRAMTISTGCLRTVASIVLGSSQRCLLLGVG